MATNLLQKSAHVAVGLPVSAAKVMMEKGKGSIINMSSTAGMRPTGWQGAWARVTATVYGPRSSNSAWWPRAHRKSCRRTWRRWHCNCWPGV